LVRDTNHGDQLGKLARYEAMLERRLVRALHELERLQAARRGVLVAPPAAVDVAVSVPELGGAPPDDEISMATAWPAVSDGVSETRHAQTVPETLRQVAVEGADRAVVPNEPIVPAGGGAPRMPRKPSPPGRCNAMAAGTCSICEHADCTAIDAALGAGEPVRTVAVRFGVGRLGVRRHRARHVRSDRTPGRAIGFGTPGSVLADLQDRLRRARIYEAVAYRIGDRREARLALREGTAIATQIARLDPETVARPRPKETYVAVWGGPLGTRPEATGTGNPQGPRHPVDGSPKDTR
jgi:hypothetical protein